MPIKTARHKPWWENAKGFVYVIKSSSGLYKIGHANDVWRRFDQHRYAHRNEELEMIAIINCENRYTTEHVIHKKYADKRVQGEWFDLSADDVEYLVDLTAQQQ